MYFKNKFYFCLFIIILLLNSYSIAQDTLTYKHYNIGFGASLLYGNMYYYPIFITRNFKIEPEILYRYDSDPQADWHSKELEFGTGIFYSQPYYRLNIYAGLRAGYSLYKSGHNYEGFYISPTLGGEYFLFNRFSLGAELQFRYNQYEYFSRKYFYLKEEKDKTKSGVYTQTFFIMRFYLF